MNYFLDTEFDGPRLLSIALIREDGQSLYATFKLTQPIESEWVKENVMPAMYQIPSHGIMFKCIDAKRATIQAAIASMLSMDSGTPNIVSDWPIDIAHLCDLLLVQPDMMINVGDIGFLVARVDSYPTKVEGAVQHNAYWDAMALRQKFIPDNDFDIIG